MMDLQKNIKKKMKAHVDVDHEIPTTLEIPNLPETQQPCLDNRRTPPGFQSKKKLSSKPLRNMSNKR